ncbi:MAG: hypothetical protein K8W52_46195 [Deltaproteobacteria bacterium]|nr:hypothetical protein [Deltaproteobacteria bacterium]
MLHRALSALALVTASVGALATTARADDAAGIHHVPPAEAAADAPLALVADIDATATAALVVRYRAIGDATWQSAPFARTEDTAWQAQIPAAAIHPPGLEYYLATIATNPDGSPAPEQDRFASPTWPHAVAVRTGETSARRARDLARVAGHRSRVHTAVEYVDFGARKLPTTTANDRYYRVDADFGYRLLAYPLEEIRFGYARLIGVTPDTTCEASACETDAGFKVGGWFELGLGLAEGVRLDARGLVAATPSGFGLGGRLELRVGVADGTHLAAGVEGLADVGTSGFMRLGWATVPGLPMAATVEVGDLPASSRPTGVRLLYDIAHPFPNGLRLAARLGYAARDRAVGGLTAGLGASWDF